MHTFLLFGRYPREGRWSLREVERLVSYRRNDHSKRWCESWRRYEFVELTMVNNLHYLILCVIICHVSEGITVENGGISIYGAGITVTAGGLTVQGGITVADDYYHANGE